MNWPNSDDLCKQMADKQDGICLLRFSCGKDAIASMIQLKRHFKTIIPIYHYLHPHLNFIEKSLKYYEGFWGTKIYRVPNQVLYSQLNRGLYQTKESWDAIKKLKLPNFDNDEVNDYIKQDLGLPINTMTAIGVRAADSVNRQMVIKKFGPVNQKRKTFYPVWDWNIEKLVSEIEKEKVKLPIDYNIWGKSFDGLDYRFIKPLKENFPDDYEKLKDLFPLLDLELKRYE